MLVLLWDGNADLVDLYFVLRTSLKSKPGILHDDARITRARCLGLFFLYFFCIVPGCLEQEVVGLPLGHV